MRQPERRDTRRVLVVVALVLAASGADDEEPLRNELALQPVSMQVNTAETTHYGSSFAFVRTLAEGIGLRVAFDYQWIAGESPFVIPNPREPPPPRRLWVGGLHLGTEIEPFQGDLLGDDGASRFGIVLLGSLGVGSTRTMMKPASETTGPATFGDAGLTPAFTFGVGLKVQLGRRTTLRVEVTDRLYSSRTESVNGCSFADLDVMDRALRSGGSHLAVAVSPGCRAQDFSQTDVPMSKNIVATPDAHWRQLVTLSAGLGLMF